MSDPRQYNEMIDMLTRLESPEFLEEMSERLVGTAMDLVQKGFASATDPYGHPWAPRQLAKGRHTPPHLPLDLSGNMKESFHPEAHREGFSITNPVVYTAFHQDGTRYLDARAMLPDERGLGDWEEPLQETARRVFNEYLNEGGG